MSEQQQQSDDVIPNCPKCHGPMWDNRVGKRNPKAPDFKCKDRSCDGVVWPPRGARPAVAASEGATPAAGGMPSCPICGGPMWDDRATKRNPRAPDFKCRNKPRERGGPGCEGVIWPPRDGSPSPYPPPVQRRPTPAAGVPHFQRDFAPGEPPAYDAPPHGDDDIPF